MNTENNNLHIDLTKIRKMISLVDKFERYNVVQNTQHDVDGITYVIATREGKPGYVRVAKSLLTEAA